MMADELKGVRYYLEQADAIAVCRESCTPGEAAQMAQAAALIALVERLDEQNEHLDYIRNHLDDIGTVLLNASGPMGAISIDVRQGE